ncbi:LUD domain-containing protein [Haloplanus sp. GCM10025708]|uniref:LUD domain-containing protein n=1 Tax=Haloferacaceae TaxID=1644056 RepID=UPI0036211E72
MSATTRFEAALSAFDATLTRTRTADFSARLDEVVDPPAVGSPLPFEGVSLDGTDVVTEPTPAQLRDATTGVTAAAFAIAEYGTLAVRSTAGGDEPVSLYPERHVAVVRESDVLSDADAAFSRLADAFADGPESVVFATGVSGTGDMGEYVEGVHGPREVRVLLLEDR